MLLAESLRGPWEGLAMGWLWPLMPETDPLLPPPPSFPVSGLGRAISESPLLRRSCELNPTELGLGGICLHGSRSYVRETLTAPQQLLPSECLRLNLASD